MFRFLKLNTSTSLLIRVSTKQYLNHSKRRMTYKTMSNFIKSVSEHGSKFRRSIVEQVYFGPPRKSPFHDNSSKIIGKNSVYNTKIHFKYKIISYSPIQGGNKNIMIHRRRRWNQADFQSIGIMGFKAKTRHEAFSHNLDILIDVHLSTRKWFVGIKN